MPDTEAFNYCSNTSCALFGVCLRRPRSFEEYMGAKHLDTGGVGICKWFLHDATTDAPPVDAIGTRNTQKPKNLCRDSKGRFVKRTVAPQQAVTTSDCSESPPASTTAPSAGDQVKTTEVDAYYRYQQHEGSLMRWCDTLFFVFLGSLINIAAAFVYRGASTTSYLTTLVCANVVYVSMVGLIFLSSLLKVREAFKTWQESKQGREPGKRQKSAQ